MSSTSVLIGPWELRHQEAASLQQAHVSWLPLGAVDTRLRTIVIPAALLGATGPLDAQRMPLAIAQRAASGRITLSHLLHVLDHDRAMFFAVDHRVPEGMPIEVAIAQAFDVWYLPLSNNECFYTYAGVQHRHVPLPEYIRASAAAQRFAQELGAGDTAPFLPRFRVPIRRSFDVATQFALTDTDQETATLYGPQTETSDPSERARPCQLVVARGRTVSAQHTVTLGDQEAAQLIGRTLGRPCAPKRVGWRTTIDVPVESAASGAVFLVTFEHRAFPDGAPEGRVTITFEKTRGPYDAAVAGSDLDRLTQSVARMVAGPQAKRQAQDLPECNIGATA